MDLSAIRTLLEGLGYKLCTREQGWSECLLTHEAERWVGLGATPNEALSHAVFQAFPSSASRSLLANALGKSEPVAAPAPVEVPVALAPVEHVVPIAPAASPAPAARAAAHVRPLPELKIVATPLPEPAPKPAPKPVAPPPPPPPPPPPAEPLPPPDSVAQVMDELSRHRDRYALSSPLVQRAVLWWWAARLRAMFGGTRIEPKAHRVLLDLSAQWWPGSVGALRLEARPSDIARDLECGNDVYVDNWETAITVAHQVLVAATNVRGVDAGGWADSGRLEPRPDAPEARFDALEKELEKVTEGEPLPPPETAQRWVRTLRWLRGATGDAMRWATTMGRLRKLVKEHPREFPEAARELEPSFSPSSSWGSVLRADDEQKREKAALDELLAARKDVSTGADPAALKSWIEKALAHPGVEAVRIAEVLAVLPPSVEVSDAWAEALGRGGKRKLRKARELLDVDGSLRQAVAPAVPLPAAPVEEPEDGGRTEVPPELLAALGNQLHGRRALFVSNRTEEELCGRLKDLLGFSRVDSELGEPRRLASAVARIDAGSYAFVFAATGFMRHSTDDNLSSACKRAGVKYVRVAKARELAVLRALEQVLLSPSERSSR